MIDDNNKMKDVCKKHNFDFESIKVIPFSGIIPEFDINVPTIFYGGTGWINNIYNKHPNHKGIFFNPESTFTFWINKYKEKALNYGAVETTFKKIASENYPDDKLFFIRPVSDLKDFNGCVMEFRDIKLWKDKISSYASNLDTIPIVVGEAHGISYEWRLFILNGKVITGSQYRTYCVLNVRPNVPQEVIDFAEDQSKIYSPSDLFVMDVCKSGTELYILEIGCFNSAGFYASDLEKLMCEASKHVEKLYEKIT
jgi:hypothetical protein